jgi:hypothetical protein
MQIRLSSKNLEALSRAWVELSNREVNEHFYNLLTWGEALLGWDSLKELFNDIKEIKELLKLTKGKTIPSWFSDTVSNSKSTSSTTEYSITEKQIKYGDSLVKRITDGVRYDGFKWGQVKRFDGLEEMSGINGELYDYIKNQVKEWVHSNEELDWSCFEF